MSKISEYNPDVLNCISNLSNDEVFTPPEIVNEMLDMLPKEIWRDSKIKFLDPFCKSGVFLREIAKRLLNGLKDEIPNLQDRIDHIFHNQLYGIAITELTSLLSRRSLYCSKYPNCKYSISQFDDICGNIRFKRIEHSWNDGRCTYCGATKKEYNRDKSYESYAYEFIHTFKPERIFDMKFDVIVGNPPYQLKVASQEDQQNAVSIYNLFVESAIKLNPKYISMIMPSRWMTGGRGLDNFRKEMINDHSLRIVHDYVDATECFPGVEIKGGVCYFLREREYKGKCNYYLHKNGEIYKSERYLDELNLGLVIRDNRSIDIINKVVQSKGFESFKKIAGSQTPFGIVTSFKKYTENPDEKNTMKIYGNKFVGYTDPSYVTKNMDLAYKYKVLAPKAVGSGIIETDKINPFVPTCPSICTQTYIIYGCFDNKEEANNLCDYMKTKFFHFLLGQLKNTQQMSPDLFQLVPLLDFKESWSDEKLYKKYNLTQDEINYIKSTVRPMDNNEEE